MQKQKVLICLQLSYRHPPFIIIQHFVSYFLMHTKTNSFINLIYLSNEMLQTSSQIFY